MTPAAIDPDPTPFEVTLSEADLVAAFRLNARRPAIRPLVLAAILVTALLGLLLAASPAARHSLTSRPLTLMLEGAVILAAGLLLLVILARPAILRGLARRTLAQRAELAGPIRWEFGSQGLRHTTIHSDSHYPWPALRGWREDEAVLLVYVADNLFYIVPKVQVDPALLANLRRTIETAELPRR